MKTWRDERILSLFRIELPIIQAPMAGVGNPRLAAAVARAGGLGSLPCALLSPEQIRSAVASMRTQTAASLNLNFFCHTPPAFDPHRMSVWQQRVDAYARAAGLPHVPPLPPVTAPPRGAGVHAFDESFCEVVEQLGPRVVSFHFGLPEASLVARVRATGARIISSATTVSEARWLEQQGCDAIIAMGTEAGGHRGTFLPGELYTQAGTFALVPQIVDAVSVPVIAAGGIADGRGLAAALMLGASAVQMGSAYLLAEEVELPLLYRMAIERASDESTALTNIFTGRPGRAVVNRAMRALGPLSTDAPPFPLAGLSLAPLRNHCEQNGADDFTPLWSGQAASLAKALPAAEITRSVAAQALEVIGGKNVLPQ
ncbi:nitronate monooxygenase family protein [Paraburkholderia sp. DHOC27]|uniref:NAD(P)H-dependent flavin oxidoreductase n=1 Tax=Paraburkholderia sp. DHOC27 TaxID=2303330 RepID=UPI000E3E8ED3|nr:nitronate monooxygenase family protein [Paraburkholderia sp. DHOC27]RFU49855.1 nitronate monooxygenase [Paraburkholderia sp. DHOC27]